MPQPKKKSVPPKPPARPSQIARAGDCVKLMRELDYSPNLIVADPPYNQGMEYDAVTDNKPAEEYLAWSAEWIGAAADALDRYGSMWIFVPDEWVSEIDLMCRKQFRLYKRRHVVWAFTFGQKASKNFTRSHCHVLYMTKAKTVFTFNTEAVAVPSARQLVYNDKRAAAGGKPPDATWMLLKEQLDPYMTPDTDTWLESRVCGTYRERKNVSPNQIPVPIMERIVAACTLPGDRVLDPFAGTGSSGVACAKLGRYWDGVDLSKKCVAACNARLAELAAPSPPKAKK